MFMLLSNGLYSNSTAHSSDLLKTTDFSIQSYQNYSYSYPSFEVGSYYQTYSQYGRLVLLPFETWGGWMTPIYSTNTIYIYNVETICYDSADITIAFYFDFGAGWMTLPLSLNESVNTFLNGDWIWFMVINFTTTIAYPSIFNFTIYAIDDFTPPPSPPYIFLDSTLMIALLLILLLFIGIIYFKIGSISLMTIMYLIFLPASIQSLWNTSIIFYPFLQLSIITFGTFLFLDFMLSYRKKQKRS